MSYDYSYIKYINKNYDKYCMNYIIDYIDHGNNQNVPVQPAQNNQNVPVQPAQNNQNVPVQRAQNNQNVPVQRAQNNQNVPVQPAQNNQHAAGNHDDAKNCCVCLSNPKNTLFLPCKHVCTCSECKQLRNCPLCRAPIESRIDGVFI